MVPPQYLQKMLAMVAFGAALAAAAPPPVKYYASKYDHIDVDAILNTRRLVNYYAACLTNKGPCPPQGLEFKRILPEALHTNCARCTEKQKTVALRTIKRIRKEYPKIWNQLSEIWDPTGEYIKRFEASFSNNRSGQPATTAAGTTGTTTTTERIHVNEVVPQATTIKAVTFESRFGDDAGATKVVPLGTTTTKAPTPTINIPTPTSKPKPPETTTLRAQPPLITFNADGGGAIYLPNAGQKLSKLVHGLLGCFSRLCRLLWGIDHCE